ncbi:MAG: type II and III secretion system protein family protein [Alphaproteobacteria bacterium]
MRAKSCALFFVSFILSTVSLTLTARAEVARDMQNIFVPVNRSSLIELPVAMDEILVANPDIADVHAHNPRNLTVVGKRKGQTNLRILDPKGRVVRDVNIVVGHDLPAIRRALRNFFPDEKIGVEMVNTSIALTGLVSSAYVVDKAVKIVEDFIHADGPNAANVRTESAAADSVALPSPEIMNMMQVASGQQVMLRVRVGELNREALKVLGVDLSAISRASGNGMVLLGTGAGIAPLVVADSGQPTVNPGDWWLPGGRRPTDIQGILGGTWQPDGPTGNSVGGLLKAMERDGLFKLLAEPNLVAISGEQAEFLAGGEIPIPVVQSSLSGGISVEYKPFGVAVKFTPQVLSENRIRMEVMPEVSEISTANSIQISGFTIPSISTRRAKTTVELAPGESFMIAGLIKDQMTSTIEQFPGVKEVPVLGALFRSTEFQRNETELVIAVTPYVVDPLKGSDVKLPTDDFRPASQMEMFFYGALGSLSGDVRALSQTPPVEGPIGFMVD